MIETVLFIVLAAMTVAGAILVIVQRSAVASAIFLIITLFCLAGIYLLLQAPFIAMIQILVYAGAIMVLFLFVIMLLNLEKETRRINRPRTAKIVGVILGGILLIQLVVIFKSVFLTAPQGNFTPEKVAAAGNTESVARLLFTDYLLPFEITSVLLLVAIIGAIILAKREI